MESCKLCNGPVARIGNVNVCEKCSNRWPTESVGSASLNEVNLAWEYLRNGEFEKAKNLFEDILFKDNVDYASCWGSALSEYGITYVSEFNKNIPTCNKLSENSFLENVYVKKAIAKAPKEIAEEYQRQAEYIENVRREWMDIASKEQPYDIFISYKESDRQNGIERTKDSIDASDLYNILQDEGYKVFFSKYSLRKYPAKRYEPYIYNAINTAKVMIVFGERPEYFNSPWVRNEWTRFSKKIENNEKRRDSLLVVYKDMNPGDLPKELVNRQSIEYSFAGSMSLIKYLNKIFLPKQEAPSPALSTEQLELFEKLKEKLDKEEKQEKLLKEKQKKEAEEKKRIKAFQMLFDYEKNKDGDEITLLRYTGGYKDELVIPKEIEGLPITYIGYKCFAFEDKNSPKKIVLPSTIDTIGRFSFQNNTCLESIEISDGVEYVGEGAFSGCTSLKSIALPDSVSRIDEDAFKNCTSLKSIKLPSSMKALDKYTYSETAFDGCLALEEIISPHEQVVSAIKEKVNNQILSDLSKNYKYKIDPETDAVIIESVREKASSIKFPQTFGNKKIKYITDYAFYYVEDFVTEIKFPTEMLWHKIPSMRDCRKLRHVDLPSNATILPWQAFENCVELQEAFLPNGINEISVRAFNNCKSLRSVRLPASLKTIREDAFYCCESLETITIPEGTIKICERAFMGCKKLKHVKLPSTLTEICEDAFRGCDSLESIDIPTATSIIGPNAFDVHVELKWSEEVLKRMEEEKKDKLKKEYLDKLMLEKLMSQEQKEQIKKQILERLKKDFTYTTVFDTKDNCSKIKLTSYIGNDPVVSIPDSFEDIVFDNFGDLFKDNQTIEQVSLPEGITQIRAKTFYNCKNLKTITLPSTLKEIGPDAFYNCEKLESLVLPNGIRLIQQRAFCGCKKLEEIVFPSSLKTIFEDAFRGCTSLVSITLPQNTETKMNCFSDCVNLLIVEGIKKPYPPAFKNTGFIKSRK